MSPSLFRPTDPPARDGAVPPREGRGTARRARPRFRTAYRTAAAAVVLALAATACGGGSGKSSGGKSPAAAVPVVQGGKAVIPLPVESRGLDPFTASYTATADGSRMTALYDLLVYLDPKTGQVKPKIAESLSPDADGKVWTLKLRPNVKFSDGTPYDAAAVKANWDAHGDPAMKSLRRALVVGVTTEVVNPLEMRITLPVANRSFDRTVAFGLCFIASPTAFKADPAGFSTKPVGAGPFTLKEWVRGDHQTMVRNPTYWQAGLPKLDEVTFKSIADNQQIFNAMSSNQADISVLSDGAAKADADKRGLNSDSYFVDGGQFFMFNLRRAPFDDPRARKAVAMAIDQDAMMKTLFNGEVTAGRGILRDNSALLEPGVQQQPSYNQAEAQRLFDELAAEGKPVKFTFLTQAHATARKTAEYMQSRLNQYRNVHMEIEAVEIGAYITKGLVNRDFQAQNYGGWQADPDPSYDTMFRSNSASNYAGYNSPAADAALDAARAAATPEQRRAAYTNLVRAIGNDLPLWVWQAATTTAVFRTNIGGIQLVNEGQLIMEQVGKTS
ncbi:ABC transporter substrate-binding protein [Uniformispora flossi]|uniref:ABC transporter substrate-binding protein n=1 Tax=Uniformispora flossi TaxID=3390723 RepID=UPI003C30318F